MQHIKYFFGYRWFKVRMWWSCWKRDLPFKLAMKLPRSVAECAFIRVYSVLGECGPEFSIILDEWKRRAAH